MEPNLDSGDLLADLVTAYRKAKVDLYYDDSPRRLDLLRYEENLSQNLRLLEQRLLGDDEDWVRDPAFCGGYGFVPKRLKEPSPPTSQRSFWSDRAESWRRRWSGTSEESSQADRPAAEFRLVGRCSIDLHVLSTLWMLHVGTRFDMKLGPSARGSRLGHRPAGEIDHFSSGSFEHYQHAYRRWRDDGLDSMYDGLNAGVDLIAMTADVTAFYHRLDPSFLLDTTFVHEVVGAELDVWQWKLNRLFVSALDAWSTQVRGDLGWDACGLPVGLPASAVVANIALVELDMMFEGTEPLFYGRVRPPVFRSILCDVSSISERTGVSD